MKLISYQTWKKYYNGQPRNNKYTLCGEDSGYCLFKSINPKDVATIIIHEVFNDEEIKYREFVYIPHYYRGKNNLMDTIEIYCKKR